MDENATLLATSLNENGDGAYSMDDMSGFSSEMLKIYYARLFPFDEIFRWLAYGNDRKLPGSDPSYMAKREFSFTMDGDIYMRYQSFSTQTEMEQSIKDKCPQKIDIGPVFNVDPAKRNAYQSLGSERAFAPIERELVFDVDMSDYDDIRTCCSGANVCLNCWPLMTIAIKVLDKSLRDDFGFEHLLWVFSGRRGVHCWVCDSRARKLSSEQRSSIAEYFRVNRGRESSDGRVVIPMHSHPALVRAHQEVLLPYFEQSIIPLQEIFYKKEASEKVLSLIQDRELASKISDAWESRKMTQSADVSAARWSLLKDKLKGNVKSKTNQLQEIVFTYTYPRLDLEVSKHMNHLLKAPFCVHPKTGKVCVPIDPENCDNFDPDNVPTLSKLLNELNHWKGDDSQSGRDSEKTSLKADLNLFRTVFLDPLLVACKKEMQEIHRAALANKAMVPSSAW